MTKHWVSVALNLLEQSLEPIPNELNELDWKQELSKNKDRLTEHLIAFANQPNGGFLVFGVSDKMPKLVGVTESEVSKIINTLTNIGRDAIEPPLVIDHAVVTYKQASILIIFIIEHAHKPVHKRSKSLEETWIRSGGATRKASRQETGGLMLHSKAPNWEGLRASKLLSVVEVRAELDIQAIIKLLQRPVPVEDGELIKWLCEEGMVTPESNGYYITNLGAIAAARNLENFDGLKRKRIRVIRYRGKNKVDTIDERMDQKGYAIAFESFITYLKHILPHSEVIQQSLRTDVSVYPEIALRELIANALIHQDFNISGSGPMVEVFDDRIEFTNPGGLLPGKRVDRLIGTTPKSRNEYLASTFRRYRICEERGTGFQKIVNSIELFGLPPVAFTALEDAFRITLYAPRKFSEMGQSERIEACYQHAVLQHLTSQTLTNTTLRARLKLHEKQRTLVSNLIAEAVNAGRIKRKNIESASSKFAEYVPYWG